MLGRTKIAVLTGFLLLAGHQRAWADLPGEAPVSSVLDDLGGRMNGAIEGARHQGDLFTWGLFQHGLDLLDAWKTTNKDLMNTAFGKLDDSTQHMFNQMDALVEKVTQNKEITFDEIKDVTAQWSQTLAGLPLSNASIDVLDYKPRVIVPFGENTIELTIVGPNISNANAELTDQNGIKLALQKSKAYELLLRLKRESLPFEDKNSEWVTYKLNFDKEPTALFEREPTQRDLQVWLLPKRLAHYKLETVVSVAYVDKSTFVAHPSGKGKDSAYDYAVPVPAQLQKDGWRIDITKLKSLKGREWITDRGGDHGHCSGIRENTLTENGFIFFMDLGHKTGTFGKKSDAYQNCEVTVPIYKTRDEDEKGPPIEGDVSWNADTAIDLPRNLKSFKVTFSVFNGRDIIVTDTSNVPLSYLSVLREGSVLIFRPNPPSDF
jgi:hypothetical protein